MIENLQAIRAKLDDDALYKEEEVLAFMNFVAMNYSELSDDGGINPAYRDKVNSLGVQFDYVNAIVQDILN